MVRSESPVSARALVLDLTPVRKSRDLRVLFLSQLALMLGNGFTVVAIPFQVFELTGSSLPVGMVGLVQGGAIIVGMLAGGTLADAWDRRRVLIGTRLLLAATSLALALNAAAPRPSLWLLFLLSAAAAASYGLGAPARVAAVPSMVRPELLPSAAALHAIINQTGLLIGPALAGLTIGLTGVTGAYVTEAVVATLSAFPLLFLRPIPVQEGAPRAGLGSIREGLDYVRRAPILLGILLVDAIAMIFGMPRAVFPALGAETFHGGPQVVGLLFAAPSAGALLGALTSGWVSRVRRAGLAVLLATGVWGGAIVGFGLTSLLPLALALLALAGAADVISEVFRGTILQLQTDDVIRGRVSALWLAQTTASPRLGDAEAGAVAALTTPAFSVVSGGVACILGVGLVAWGIPVLRTATVPRVEEPPASDLAEKPGRHGGASGKS